MNGPIGILKYDLSDEYQAHDFKCAQNGMKYHGAIDELYSEVFRPIIKYGLIDGREAKQSEIKTVNMLWDKVNAYLKDRLDE